MGKTVLEHETQSDINDAILSMDGLNQGRADRPEYNLVSLPLPIVHKDFHFSARQIATSRNSSTPLDTSMAELAARKVAEMVEKLLLGVAASYSFGGGTVYGYTNYPNRLTKSLTASTGTNHEVTVREVLQMKQQAYGAFHYGPYFCYCSPGWDEFMDDDYSVNKGANTLRDRIAQIEGVDRPVTLDFLPDTTLLLVQKTTNVVRAVTGMNIQTIQWPTQGGMQLNYKVMGILVPELRADHYNKTGIVHGSV